VGRVLLVVIVTTTRTIRLTNWVDTTLNNIEISTGNTLRSPTCNNYKRLMMMILDRIIRVIGGKKGKREKSKK
jgi:hypothetical protein